MGVAPLLFRVALAQGQVSEMFRVCVCDAHLPLCALLSDMYIVMNQSAVGITLATTKKSFFSSFAVLILR